MTNSRVRSARRNEAIRRGENVYELPTFIVQTEVGAGEKEGVKKWQNQAVNLTASNDCPVNYE